MTPPSLLPPELPKRPYRSTHYTDGLIAELKYFSELGSYATALENWIKALPDTRPQASGRAEIDLAIEALELYFLNPETGNDVQRLKDGTLHWNIIKKTDGGLWEALTALKGTGKAQGEL